MPKSVKLACLFAALAIIVGAIDVLLQYIDVTTQDTPVTSATAFWVGTAFTVLLLVLIAARKNWAKWIYIVLTGLTLPFAVFVFFKEVGIDRIGAVSTLLQGVLQLLSVIFLLSGSSSLWFRNPTLTQPA